MQGEAQRLLGAARAWLAEWLEEGVTDYQRGGLAGADKGKAQVPAKKAQNQHSTQAPQQEQPQASHETETASGADDSPAAAAPQQEQHALQREGEPGRQEDKAPQQGEATHPAQGAVATGGDEPSDQPSLFAAPEGAARAPSDKAQAEAKGDAALPDPPPERRSLEAVRIELGDCTRCGLCKGRTQIVFGDGNENADLMFIGEGPGEQEDMQGIPFVGRAGELLTKMIEEGLKLPRRDVYICNIVKCRPPENRDPKPDEVAACRPFLDGQIDAVRPRVIVALGRPAASLLLGRNVAITRERGQWNAYRGIPVMPTFHPAYVLRRYTAETRGQVWQDLLEAQRKSREGQPG